ncbi:MAG: hypothetical protein ACYCZO_05145 [Daejeonella sp.]
MKIFKTVIFLAGILAILTSFRIAVHPEVDTLQKPATVLADTIKLDEQTGLIQDQNLVFVKANCMACHTTKLIQQHRFSREGWTGKIRWMQKNHNLWDLGTTEKSILDYLEKYYSPESASNKIQPRRMPLKSIKWYKL